MATIQRPLKEGSVRTYQGKVGLGFVDILASEMDADLDTIYAAWNGGISTVDLGNGSVTYAKLAPDAQLWADTGSTLTPGPNFATRTVFIAPTGNNNPLSVGSRTIKGRLVTQGNNDLLYVTLNATLNPANTAWVQDDVAKPSWMLVLNDATDAAQLYRVAAGASSTTVLLTLDATGNLTVPGNTHTLGQSTGSLAVKLGPRGQLYADAGVTDLYANSPSSLTYDRNGQPSWQFRLGPGTADNCQLLRRPAGSDTFAEMMHLDTGGFQIVGAVAIKASGTTWANPSDRRLKDEIADYPTGLAAVLQLQPRTFVYNGKGGSTAGVRGCGFIADEVATAMPEMVGSYHYTREGADDTETDYATVDQSNLILALVNAVQELAARMTALEAPT
jgi:Chaperone of endosialidase